MCDTFVAVGTATADGSVILGKNSDRQPNEPQEVISIPRSQHGDDTLRCTYIEIPQIPETCAVLLSKPNWIWGAEMGLNEHGVAIGNEAVWTIFNRQNREERLIGMDMVRLGLERARTATQALEIMTKLLETHGQGGNCGFDKPEYYDNSFIIADPNGAWVLETAGEFWIAERVESVRSISNTLTIGSNHDRIHPGLIPYAIKQGLCRDEDDFNFRRQFSDRYNLIRVGARGDARAACTTGRLRQLQGGIIPADAFSTLRDHNTPREFAPRKGSMRSPCLHASSLLTPSQTTGSMVAHLGDAPVAWMTGTSSPCISIFKPFIPGGEGLEPLPSTYDPAHLWWRHEAFHRRLNPVYREFIEDISEEIAAVEQELLSRIRRGEEAEATRDALEANHAFLERWTGRVAEARPSVMSLRYRWFWGRLSRKAGMNL